MPKVAIAEENKVAVNNDYPRLKLAHNETALILCIEPEPDMEYRHTLKAPEIGPDGRIIKETKTNQKTGQEYEAVSQEFFGQHLCFGDFNVLSSKGVDPENCPTCRAAVEEDGIDAPMPHYAMHVIRYNTKSGGFQLVEPFSVKLEAWVFAPGRFNQLIEIAKEAKDLRKHDLKLGPCQNKDYQKYDVQLSLAAQWLEGETADEKKARKQLVAETYSKNQCPDLSQLIARKIEKSKAMEDISRVLDRMAQVSGRKSTTVTDIPDLNKVTQSINDDVADVLGEGASTEVTAGTVTEPTTEAVTEEAATSPSTATFEDLMKDL